jgi:hypothetical protein
MEMAGKKIPLDKVIIGAQGDILSTERLAA